MDMIEYLIRYFHQAIFPEMKVLKCPHFDFGARKWLNNESMVWLKVV